MPEPDNHRPAYLQLVAISWNFGWPVAAGVMVGHWLDEKLGSSPAATLVLGLGAMAAAIWRMVDLGRQDVLERHEEEERHERDEHGDQARDRTGDEPGDEPGDEH